MTNAGTGDAGQGKLLTYSQALSNPCDTCPSTPCCNFLPLHTFKVEDLAGLDHALYALSFECIELGLSSNGTWSVYYNAPCRHLDLVSGGCLIHESAERPRICAHYDPYGCWYKRSLSPPAASEGFIRIDRGRMGFIVDRMRLDENGTIQEVPDWQSMCAAFAGEPAPGAGGPFVPPAEDPVLAAWKEGVSEPVEAGGHPTFGFGDRKDPCNGCDCWCCKFITFPHPRPGTRSNLDFMRFMLGFPGVEIGVSDQQWSVVVRTRCMHLADGRCAMFGKPERPRLCTFYDSWQCSYRIQFGAPRSQGYLRVTAETLPVVTDGFRFDENGLIVGFPSTEDLRARIEQGWVRGREDRHEG